MKNLGQIQIGGSLDITTNRHVEDLIEEALEGLVIPEDTNTTYTLTQDGLTVQLVDDQGRVVSEVQDRNTTYTLSHQGTKILLVNNSGMSTEIDLAEIDLTPILPEEKDPYQEEKEFIIPPESLYVMLNNNFYESFDITSEYDEASGRISVYLHLHRRGITKTIIIADAREDEFKFYSESGEVLGQAKIIGISRSSTPSPRVNVEAEDGTYTLLIPKIQTAVSSELNLFNGIVISANQIQPFDQPGYLHIPGATYTTRSEPTAITGTLEDHIQRTYESIHLYE